MLALLVLGSGIFFATGSEVIIRTYIKPGNDYETLREDLRSSPAAYFAVADSHGASAFDNQPDFINLSSPGDNVETSIAKAEYFLANASRRGLILQADVQLFAPYRLTRSQEPLQHDLTTPEDPFFQFLRPHYRRYLVEFWKQLPDLVKPRDVDAPAPTIRESARIIDQPKEAIRKQAQIRTQLHQPIMDISATWQGRAYRNFLKSAKDRGLQICMVSFPLSSYYRDEMAGAPGYAAAREWFRSLASEFDVTYLDHSQALADDAFRDVDHLNSGAKEDYSRKVLGACFPEFG